MPTGSPFGWLLGGGATGRSNRRRRGEVSWIWHGGIGAPFTDTFCRA